MTLQEKVENLILKSLNGYGLIKGLGDEWSQKRSTPSLDVSIVLRPMYVKLPTRLESFPEAFWSGDLAQNTEQYIQGIEEHEQVVAEHRAERDARIREVQEAAQYLQTASIDEDYYTAVGYVNRIIQNVGLVVDLDSLVKSIESMRNMSKDLRAVDKRKSRLMVAYFNDLLGDAKDTLKEAKKQKQAMYDGNLSPNVVAESLFSRYEDVDLEQYREPLLYRASQGIGQAIQAARNWWAERREREPQPQPAFLTYLPANFRRLNQLIAQEYISTGWPLSSTRQKRKALNRARELGADSVIPFKALNSNPIKAFEFYRSY